MREHEPAASGRCLWCGARPDPAGGFGGRSCIERAAPAPEPQRRLYACEDTEAIAARLAELAAERGTAAAQAAPAEDRGAIDPGDCCI